MNVHYKSRDFTNREIKVLTQSDGSKRVSEAVDSVLEVVDFIRYDYIGMDPEAKDGEEKEVQREAITLITAEGERFRSINKAFVDRFDELVDDLDGEPIGAIRIIEKESANGRKYLTCALEF